MKPSLALPLMLSLMMLLLLQLQLIGTALMTMQLSHCTGINDS
jgi:hypothetical protein